VHQPRAEVQALVEAAHRVAPGRRGLAARPRVFQTKRAEDEQGEGVGAAGVGEFDERLDAVQREMADPDLVRAVGSKLPPPPGQDAAAGKGRGRRAAHVPPPSQKRNARPWRPAPCR
jgi:hypothetical protein